MAELVFDVKTNLEEVRRLRDEIVELRVKMEETTDTIERDGLAQSIDEKTSKLRELVSEAAVAAVKMKNEFSSAVQEAAGKVGSLAAELTVAQQKLAALKSSGAGESAITEAAKEVEDLDKELKKTIDSYGKLLDDFGDTRNIDDLGDALGGLQEKIQKLQRISILGFGLNEVKQFLSKAFETRSYFQDIESSMQVFLGSAEKAAQFTDELRDYAWYNMFEFSDLAQASQQLIAYGNDVEDVIPIINKLSEVATATKAPLGEFVSMYNRAKNLGGVDSKSMQTWAAHGLVLNDILEEMGENVDGTSVSFEQLDRVLDYVTQDGQMFGGIMENMMDNLSSSYGQLQDDLANMFNEIGESLQGVFKTGIETASFLVDHYKVLGKAISGLVTAYGTYRASLLVVNALADINKAKAASETVATYVLTKAKEKLLAVTHALNAAMKANPWGIALSVLTGAIAAITLFNSKEKESAQAVNDATAEMKKDEETLSDLKKRIEETKEGTTKHKEAIDEANKLCEKYNVTLLNENDTLEEQKTKYENLKIAIREANAEKIAGAHIQEEEEKAEKKAEGLAKKFAREVNPGQSYDPTALRSRLSDDLLDQIASQAQQLASGMVDITDDYELNKAINDAVGIIEKSIVDNSNNRREDVSNSVEHIRTYLRGLRNVEKNKADAIKRIEKTAGTFMDDGDAGNAEDNSFEGLFKKLSETNERDEDAETKFLEVAVNGTTAVLKKRKQDLDKQIDELEEGSYSQEAFKKASNVLKDAIDKRDDWKKSDTTTRNRKDENEDPAKAAERIRKYSETQRKQQVEAARSAVDIWYDTQDAVIAAMDEGADKTLAKMENDNLRQMEQLRRDYEDLRDEKIKRAKELYEANPENYDSKGKLIAPFTYDYNDHQFDATDDEAERYAREADAVQQNYRRERAKVVLGEYKDMASQRTEIERKYNEDLRIIDEERNKVPLEERAKYDAAYIAAEKEKNNALLNLDMQTSGKIKKAFGDVAKMTTLEVAESIETLESLLNDGTVRSEENIESIQNALKNLRSVSEDMSFDGLMKNFSKAIGENGKKGLVQQFKNIKDAWGNMSQEQKWSAIGGWVGDIAGGLGQAAEYMSQIADATGNEGLKESAEQMSAVAQNFSAAAKGAASGGWVGAIVGGVTDIIGQTISSFTEAEVQTAIMKKNAEDFANALQLAALTVDKTDFESIFGADRMRLANEYAKKMAESLRTYGDAMNDLNRKTNEYTMRYYGMGSAERGLKRMRDRGKELLGIRDMMIKTLDRSGWSNFWGKSDEYTRLGDLAPELFNGEELNLEALKQFLDTNTQISEEQRSQLQNLLDIREAYEENKKALEDYLSGLFGNMASDLAQATIDGMRDGSEIGVQYMRDNMLNAITSLEQQLVQGVYNSYLSKYQQRFMETIEGGGGEEDLLGSSAEMFSGMDDTIKKATLAAEQFEQQAEKYGFDMDKLRSDYEENASSGSFQAMTQQMGAALEGRFTAVQISNEAIREQATMANAKLDVMMANAVSCVRIAEEIQNVQAMALIELQAINRNTRPLANMAEEISTIRSKVERL